MMNKARTRNNRKPTRNNNLMNAMTHWYRFFGTYCINYHSSKLKIMRNRNKKDKNQEQHVTRNTGAQTTSPANLRSGDKLRENPSNDEETIAQQSRKSEEKQREQSPLSKQHDGDRNQITNQQNQQEVVNPSGGDWDEPEKEPTPTTTPYEGVNDDPDGTQRKIPKM